MKNIFKISSRMISAILIVALIITSMPMQSFAKAKTKKFINPNKSTLLIKDEVLDERTEYKKVYQLQDGTFYEINSIIPLHYYEGNKWLEVNENKEVPTNINEAIDYCSELTEDLNSQSSKNANKSTGGNRGIDINESETTGTSSVTYRVIGKNAPSNETKLKKTTYLVAKFDNQSLLNNTSNKATINCNFVFRSKCSKLVNVYAHNITNQFNILDNNLCGTDISFSEQILDYAEIKNTSNYGFDITDLYIKWEKGLVDNNGVLLETSTANEITVYGCFITRQYRIFDLYDMDYSYHKVPMGRAGTVYINDYTNTVMLSRDEFSFDSNVLPINLKRYYDFGRTDEITNPFGDSGWWNYESNLKVITNLNYKWQTPDGNCIYFIPNPDLNSNGTNKYWMDYKGEGYELELDITKTNLFENAVITTPYNESYVFGTAGKMTSVSDEYGNLITVKYHDTDLSQSNIIYIQDSLQRRLYFNYDDLTIGNSTYEVLKNITAKYKNSNNSYSVISIDGSDAIMTYNYVAKDNEKVLLSSVTYPDNKTVSYNYTNNMLTSIVDIDGRTLNLNYDYEISNNNTKNIYPCLVSYSEIISDDESNEDVILSSLDIDSHNSYQRIFTNEQNQEEIIQYNNNLRTIYYHTPDNTFFADYKNNPNGYEYMSQILSPEDATNLVDDPSFEGDNENWTFDQGYLEEQNPISGDCSLTLQGAPKVPRMATQTIEINGSEGDIYVLGGWSMANTPIPNNKYYWGMEVHSYGEDDENNEVDNLLFSTVFDSTIDNEPQMRMGAFVLPEDTDEIEIQLIYSYQNGTSLFDDIIFYETTDEYATMLQDPWISGGDSSNSNNEDEPEEGLNANGLKTYELYSKDNTNILKTYEYDSNTLYRTAYTDENNVRIETNYNNQTGTLSSESLGYMTKTYSYNAVGALKEISRADSAVGGDTSQITTKYSYSNDKIKSIEHNGFVYTFSYNVYGSVKKVELNRVGNENNKDTLIEYEYTNDAAQDITKITYADGTELIYETTTYNNGTYAYSKLVKYKNASNQLEPQYEYFFDNSDELLKCVDYQSSRIIEYGQNSYIIYDADNITSNNPTLSEICEITTNNTTGVKTIELYNNAYTVSTYDGVYNSSDRTTTYVSDYDFSFGNDSLSFTSTSLLDFFGRKTTSSMNFDEGSITRSITSSYTYKNFNNRSYNYFENNNTVTQTINTSSSLVSKYQTDIIAINKTSNDNSTVSQSFISTYEYDSAGRVIEERYGENENSLELLHAYDYDNFGQLKTEADFIHNTCTVYTYDHSGNILSKTTYSGDNAFTYSNLTITINTNATSETVNYSYSNENDVTNPIQNNDLLVSYDNKAITYDAMGNPNVYYGQSLITDNNSSNDVTMDLNWKGTQLASATNRLTGDKTEYKYDQDGNRTKKEFYEMQEIVPEQGDPYQGLVKTSEIDYVYFNDLVTGYRIKTKNSDNENIESYIKLIYDEYNAPIGLSLSSPADISVNNNVILAQNDILWFIKDGQGNVRGMYSECSDFAVGCSYNAYGKLVIDSVDMSAIEDLSIQFQQAITENPRWALLLGAIYVIVLAAMVSAVVPTVTLINHTYYQGYIYDAETGLYYCHNRYYSPEYGRFINMDDPSVLTQNMEEPLNANLYCYCFNDPINNNDPTGRSSYSVTGIGLQAEMSASLLSFAAELGIELIYAIPKRSLYAYFYYGGGAGAGYTNKAISYFRNTLNKITLNPSVSLNNTANLFKFNYSISIGFFIAKTNKSFSWPNSYTGYSTSNSISIGKYKGYYSTGTGSKIYGICYCPIGNSGFGLSKTVVNYKRITFNTDKVKTYLSQNTNKIKSAIGK